jgi:hypothetical protein
MQGSRHAWIGIRGYLGDELGGGHVAKYHRTVLQSQHHRVSHGRDVLPSHPTSDSWQKDLALPYLSS